MPLTTVQQRHKKALIADLHTKGLSIGYDCVIDIHSSLAQKVKKEYNAKGNVIPSQLQAAIDNFDYNLKSSTASTSIQWTGISIFQHPRRGCNNFPLSKVIVHHYVWE